MKSLRTNMFIKLSAKPKSETVSYQVDKKFFMKFRAFFMKVLHETSRSPSPTFSNSELNGKFKKKDVEELCEPLNHLKDRFLLISCYHSDFQDVCCICVSASERSITIYDASTLTHAPLYCVSSLPNIPTCLAYNAGGSPPVPGSQLVIGTERGDVSRLVFLQPRVSLLPHNSDSIHYYYWFELAQSPHTSYCSLHTWKRVHSRSVRRLAFTRNGEILLSCSHDGEVSLRMKYVTGMLPDYVICVPR
ncbi:unnamed protein product, partial [Leptidea sinapis]